MSVLISIAKLLLLWLSAQSIADKTNPFRTSQNPILRNSELNLDVKKADLFYSCNSALH